MCTQINFINGLYLHLNIKFVGNDPHINPTDLRMTDLQFWICFYKTLLLQSFPNQPPK